MSNQDNSGAGYVKLPTEQMRLPDSGKKTISNSADTSSPLMAPSATLDTTYTHKPVLKRYSASFKSLIPIRRRPRTAERLPVDKIGLISMISFHWLSSFIWKAQKLLSVQTVSLDDSSKKMGERFYNLQWKAVVNRGREDFSMTYVLWKFIQTRALVATFLFLLGTSIHIAGLVSFIQFLDGKSARHGTVNSKLVGAVAADSHSKSTKINIYAAFVYCLTEFFSAIFLSWNWSMNYRTAIRAQSAVMYFLYKRMMATSCINFVSTQQITRYFGIDSQKIFYAVLYTPLVISAPLVFFGCSSCVLFLSFSWKKAAFLAPFGLLSFCVMIVVSQAKALSGSKAEKESSCRLSELRDMLLNIKLAKMAQWNDIVLNNFRDRRYEELQHIKESYIWHGIGMSLVHTIPIISASTLLLFSGSSNVPSYMVLGALMLVFIPMKTALHNFWIGLSHIQTALISLLRLKQTELLQPVNHNVNRGIDQQVAVSVHKVSCEWHPKLEILQQKDENRNIPPKWCFGTLKSRYDDMHLANSTKLILENVSLIAEKGSVIGLCGESGSGKTALLLAILGQLRTVSGAITKNGFCAYVNQNPWIWDATLRENVVFMEEFKQDRYYNAIYSCFLSGVLQNLPTGDETGIGNQVLSMGARQRVELARALYANRDIYLLDEPLTMVDPNTQRNVFEKAILTALRGKTVFISTTCTMFLTRCDIIYVLKDGKIVGSGQHEELLNTCDYYVALLNLFMDNTHNYQGLQSYGSVSTLSSEPFKPSSTANGSLSSIITACDDEVAALTGEGDDSEDIILEDSLSTYFHYWKQQRSRIFLTCGLLLQLTCFLCIAAIPLLFILKFEANTLHAMNSEIFYGIVAAVTIVITVAFFGSAFAFVKVMEDISTELSISWMKRISNTYLTFIQKETANSILNWFSLNLDSIDLWVPQSLINMTGNIILFMGFLIVLSYTFVWILLPVIVIGILGFICYKIYLNALPNFHKLGSESSSNLNAYMSTTVEGRTCIQSYSKEIDFIHSFVKQCDQNAASLYIIKGSLGCISFWISMLKVVLIILVFSMIAVIRNHQELLPSNHKLTATTIGFIFICINLLGNVLQGLTEDVAEYLLHFKDFEVNSKLQNVEIFPMNSTASQAWPEEGSILFQNVKLKFWPPNHKALTFKIKNSHKIGVMGYPDAGRKSIGAALFRLVELVEGHICIGGVNIEKIPLDVLRSNIAIIPYNPILFRGTIRSNLLSTNDNSIRNMYEALETVGMRQKVEELPQQAETLVQTENNLFTTGECQLLYLARAILSKPKILIVEEPLVPVNRNIHHKLQEVIETVFHRTTVLIVAQHFRFVEYCEKLLLIKDGQVIEYDTPARLLRNPRSALSAMVTETEL